MIIGGLDNTLIAIRQHVGGPVVAVTSTDVLRCDSFVGVWFSWSGGKLSVGQGTVVGSSPLIHWPYGGAINVKAVSFSSDVDQTVYWRFHRQHGWKTIQTTFKFNFLVLFYLQRFFIRFSLIIFITFHFAHTCAAF